MCFDPDKVARVRLAVLAAKLAALYDVPNQFTETTEFQSNEAFEYGLAQLALQGNSTALEFIHIRGFRSEFIREYFELSFDLRP